MQFMQLIPSLEQSGTGQEGAQQAGHCIHIHSFGSSLTRFLGIKVIRRFVFQEREQRLRGTVLASLVQKRKTTKRGEKREGTKEE